MLKKILIVEDNENLRTLLQTAIADEGYVTLAAPSGAAALEFVNKKTPDLVILDLGLPDIAGETVCREIKKNFPNIQVIMLTAKSKSSEVVTGFKVGADDYISKPFEIEELLARIKARFRAIGEDESAVFQVGDLELNSKTFEVKRGGKLIPLTQKEFELLKYLMANKEHVLSREMILNKVWLYSPNIESRVVDVYVGYLRKKIDAGSKKKLIFSKRGFGYSIKE